MIPEGKHRARATDWDLGEASTGTQQIGVQFEFLDEPHTGTRMTWFGFFTDKALASTVKALRAMGWTGADPSELAGRGGTLDANEVTLVVENETDQQGQARPRIRWVNPAGGMAMAKPLAGDSLRAFGAQMRAKILALDPANAAKHAARPAAQPARTAAQQRPAAQPQRRPEPPPVADEDVPF